MDNSRHTSRKLTTQIASATCWMLMFIVLSACSVTKHIPEDSSVVSRVNIIVDGKPSSNNSLKMAVSQKSYHRTFGFIPMAAWIWYNDSTNWYHRMRNKMGTAPSVYDEERTLYTERAMQRTLSAQGYLFAKVTHDVEIKNRKATVTYNIDRGLPKRIASVKYLVEDPALQQIVDNGSNLLRVGNLLDRNNLEEERTRLTSSLRDSGYWDFNKDDISFIADTLRGSQDVDLTVMISRLHEVYTINKVRFVTNFDILTNGQTNEANVNSREIPGGYEIEYEGDNCYLKDNALIENCHLVPGKKYSETDVRNTYSAYSRLRLLKYTNLRLEPTDDNKLNVSVYLSQQNPKALQFELDGTNTSGDLGFAGALTYLHRNLFHGSETYTATLKGGYESLTGNVSGLVNDNYSEYSFENSIEFPKFLFPWISNEERRKRKATTNVSATFSYQSRPEYTRFISTLGYSYKWQSSARQRHTLDVLDLSYVYLPKRSDSFIAIIEKAGPISYSSYSSHLIMASGYNLYLTNQVLGNEKSASDVWSLRVNPEIAGNVLMAISSIAKLHKNSSGNYELFGQPFQQYARFDMDWSYSKFLTDRSRLAFHFAGGVAVPYGNSSVVPFEKRYYSGGANSVRGWSVRTLGPGRYHSEDSSLDYFNQCGDVRIDASVELRSKLFWKFEFAAFIDAGNVWTLKNYDNQPDGAISSDFYKEIASSWGVGLRMVTDFVVLRLDMGIKAYDPAYLGKDAWVINKPFNSDNRAIHFAVGYPF